MDFFLSTGVEEIVEQTSDDDKWGCGTKGTGLNMLGKLLTDLRTEYRSSREYESEE